MTQAGHNRSAAEAMKIFVQLFGLKREQPNAIYEHYERVFGPFSKERSAALRLAAEFVVR